MWKWIKWELNICDNVNLESFIQRIDLDPWAPFYLHGLTLTPAWISHHMSSKVWDEITYPFLNFNGATAEVYE